MKTRKAISFLTAAVMAVSAIPVLSVGAEDTAVPGDVDMDGYLTGHDAALVSRYLQVGDITLTEGQLTLADVNADGAVDQTDADWIYENEIRTLGEVLKTQGEFCSGDGVGIALNLYAMESVGKAPNIVDLPLVEFPDMKGYSISGEGEETEAEICLNGEWVRLDPEEDAVLYQELLRIVRFGVDYGFDDITQMECNILDVDGDNSITMDDAVLLLAMYAEEAVGRDTAELYFGEGKYYVDMDSLGDRVYACVK